MGLLHTIITKPEAIEENLDNIRSSGFPKKLFNNDYLSSLGFDREESVLYVKLFTNLGLIDENGVPTLEYALFVNSEDFESVLSKRLWEGYSLVFDQDIKAGELPIDTITAIFQQLHGNNASKVYARLVAKTFKALIKYAKLDPVVKPADPEYKHGIREVEYPHQSNFMQSKHEMKDTCDDPFELMEDTAERTNSHPSDMLSGLMRDDPEFIKSKFKFDHSAKQKTMSTDTPVSERNNMYSKALSKKVELLQKLKRTEEAIKAINQIIEHHEASNHPDRNQIIAEFLMRKAELLEEDGEIEAALSTYEDFIVRELQYSTGL